ncbi:unnamed protein product [Miscanthus lutarioriparius]|uniref:Wax synthase domain-containing protein n=1 Tax=Miscanthus lutarioriparius TaxID=422564 RepID=A0A811QY70_9POAL|nr:unnamed protein product [Miscanthus lutarioriparius]
MLRHRRCRRSSQIGVPRFVRVKVAIIAAILHAYQYVNQLHLYIRLALYGVHMYCFLDFLLPCIAAAGGALGMEMEPQFDRPYLASSLRDFWGRRWNLMVSAILRPSVYDPVRARRPEGTGRPGHVPRVRADARGHDVLSHPAITHR